jgi:serine/threonine-protein kinase
MIGTIVGTRFHIVGRIGEGWLFTVYRARDQLTGQLVAVKVVRPTFTSQRSFVEALLRTFEQLLHLAHPSLVRYIASGEIAEENIPFLVCELVAGHPLTYSLQRRIPLPIRQALDLLSQAADGISYLHRANIVHGDVRPHNILVTPRGEVKVGDYGLWEVFLSSKIAETEWLEQAAPYLPPEHFQGEKLTAQSDVYSLGVVLFQALTGRLPFEATRVADFAHMHLTAPVPLASSLNPSVPFALDAVLLRAMAKDPSQRFADAGEFRNALQEVLASLNTVTEAVPSIPETTVPLEEEAQKGEERSVWQKVMQPAIGLVGGLVIGLIIVSGVIYSLLVGTKPNEVIVPDVTGMKLSQAQKILAERNLKLRVVRWEFSKEVPPEHIIRMESPEPNQRVLEGREVRVVASQGAAKVIVPDLSGQSLQDALATIKNAKLRLGQRVDTYSETVSAGYVIGQQPPPSAEVPEETPINIIVSKGPPPPEPQIDWSRLPPDARVAKVAIAIGGTELRQIVQIIVTDSKGEREVYRGVHVPGDRITKTVVTYGPAKIRVLVNGQEVAPPEEL